MTSYINQIVQLTRQMHAVDPAITGRDATPDDAARYTELSDRRYEVVLAAVKDGVDPDLMSWAISLNDHPAKVQAQYALAHVAAAEALTAETPVNDQDDADEF